MKSYRFIVLLIVLLVCTGCGINTSESTSETIKIGFFGPLSGPSASDGINARNAAQLAVDLANKANTSPQFELIAYDDTLDADVTTEIINKLINEDKVQVVISGSYSSPSRVAAPLLQQAGIPMIAAYAVHPEITQAGNMVFRMIYTGPVQGKALAVFGMQQMQHDSFNLVHINNDYGRTISEGFNQHVTATSGSIMSFESFEPDATDFTAQIETIKAKPGDAIILVGYYAQSSSLIKQLRAAGVSTPIIGSDGLDSPKLLELAGADAENVILATDFSRDDPRTRVKDFIRAFQDAYATQPDVVSASTYDSTTLVIEAIQRSSARTPQAIRDAIAATSNFEGVTGTINFTTDREVNKTVLFVQVVRGDFIFLDKLDPNQM